MADTFNRTPHKVGPLDLVADFTHTQPHSGIMDAIFAGYFPRRHAGMPKRYRAPPNVTEPGNYFVLEVWRKEWRRFLRDFRGDKRVGSESMPENNPITRL